MTERANFTVHFRDPKKSGQFKQCTVELSAGAVSTTEITEQALIKSTTLAKVLRLAERGNHIAVCHRGSFSQRPKDWVNGQITADTRLVLETCHVSPVVLGTISFARVLAEAFQSPVHELWVVLLCPDPNCRQDGGHGIATYSNTAEQVPHLQQCRLCQRRDAGANSAGGGGKKRKQAVPGDGAGSVARAGRQGVSLGRNPDKAAGAALNIGAVSRGTVHEFGTDGSRQGEFTLFSYNPGTCETDAEVLDTNPTPFAATFWGDVKVYGNVYQSSDARAKEDIEDAGVKITGEEREGYIGQLATIMQLELKKYKYKKGIPGHSNDTEEVGIIAQQLREVGS